MWRRLVSSHLTTLAAAFSSSSIQSVASIAEPSFLASRPSTPFRPSSSVLARYFATESEVSKKKVEVVNPIATGHEREELEAELQGKDNLEINYPVGPFGTKGSKLSEDCSVLYGFGLHSLAFFRGSARLGIPQPATSLRFFTAAASPVSQNSTALETDVPARIKFKRLDKTARHIMQILDKEAVEDVKTDREIPDIKPGYIVQLKLEVPENKRRITTIKGIVIARRNAGLNTTFRIRRLVAGVGVESLLPLYSPNIKEIKVLDKKKVRRAKLYYLREKMNALRK